jgi:hypothetical protein
MSEVSEILPATPSVVATEMARRKALEAMGIDVYVSRFDLPGAARAVRQRVESSSPSAVPDHSSETGARSVETATWRSETPAPTQAPLAAVRERSEAVRFSMLLASAGPFLWIEQLSDGLIRQDQLALINAMARAISPQASIRQQQFDWPMRGGSAVASDAESAKQALQGLIQRMAREVNAKRVVVMGTCPFLSERIAQSAVVIPSTIAMLSNASLKREAWQALKPLRVIELD